jgi:pimeloyl-ACP methyl ester carboxylesterase
MKSPYDPRIAVEGDGPPLVLVPGMDGTGRLFYRQAPLLARRHRVGTYTLRDAADHMDVLVEDLVSVIGTLAPSGAPAVVVGESFGGAIALSLALAHPELVAALVVLNSFPRFLPQTRLRLAIAALRLIPWQTMPLVRRLTAFRLHSRFTHRAEIHRLLELTREASRDGYLARLQILSRTTSVTAWGSSAPLLCSWPRNAIASCRRCSRAASWRSAYPGRRCASSPGTDTSA